MRCDTRATAVILLPLLLGITGASAAAGHASGGAGDSPGRESPQPVQRAADLAAAAAKLMADGRPAEAATALRAAIELEPRNARHAYALACALARQGETLPAMDELERAAGMGFTGFAALAANADLAGLRELPRFKRLLALKDAYLRRTAEGTMVALRNRFGEKGYLYEIDDDARLVFAVATDAAALRQLRAELRDQAAALKAALFGQEPEAYVSVVMPTGEDYGKLVRFRNVPGLYVASANTLLARERGHVMTHEFTHALHAADLAPLGGQAHAPWVNEGLGVLTESASFAGGKFVPRDPARFAALPSAARRKGLIPLERLVAMDQREFVRRPNLTYAQSGYLMLYLWEREQLRDFYETYKKTHAADATGRAALEGVTGKTLPELHEDFRLWLAARGSGGGGAGNR